MSFKKNFISELCTAESLIDISDQCTAEQSSISRWSRGNDASRLLVDHDDEYANHTEFEVNPWVLIDMKQARKPAYIVVQNRDTKFAGQVSKTVRVEYSLNGNDFSLMHEGEVVFGALPNSIPLILPLSKEVPFRYLRISLNSKNKVPLSASSKRPLRWSLAPVNAPFSWPNNSDSSKLGVNAAQFTFIKACSLRLLSLYKLRATNSLPVPFSPSISTVLSVSLTSFI